MLQLCGKIIDLLSDFGQTRDFHRKIFFSQCSVTSPVTEKTKKMNAWQIPES